jgi:hypothetical protein
MDELEAVERLVRRARQEQPSARDVTGAVLAGIRAGRPAGVLPLSVVAAVASLAAAVVLALAIHNASAGVDPEAALFPLVEVMQP